MQGLCVFFAIASILLGQNVAAQNLSKLTPEQSKEKREKFVSAALAYRGTPYLYGGTTKRGMDCSGLISTAGREGAGISLPRTASSLSQHASKISDSELEPGDLVFFNTTGGISHVGIYIGNGEFVHSASAGPKTGVIVSKLAESYWKRTYRFAGRIFPSAASAHTIASAQGASSPSPNASSTKANSAPSEASSSSPVAAGASGSPSSSPSSPPSKATAVSAGPPPAGSSPNGFRLELRATALWDFNIDEYLMRGTTISATAQWRGKINFYPGLTAGFTWDTRHDTMAVPLCLSIGLRNGLAFFAGTQFVFNSGGEGSGEIFFPSLVGVSWNSPYKDLGPVKIGFYQSIECVFVPKEGVAGKMLDDTFRLATGVSLAFGK